MNQKTGIAEMVEWLDSYKDKPIEPMFDTVLGKSHKLLAAEQSSKPVVEDLVEIELKADVRVRYEMGIEESCESIFVRKEDLCAK